MNAAGNAARKREVDLTIGVVIVCYRSSSTIAECVLSCLADPSVARVIVVDNSRDEATQRQLDEVRVDHGSRVSYVAPARNVGFAAGCNLGAARLPAVSHLFLVNPDVVLDRPLASLVARADEDAVILSARLLTPGSINARRTVTPWREFLKAVFGPQIYSRGYLRDLRRSGRAIDVEQADGALLGFTSADWTRLGGLDERFELYYEDVDICRRALDIGRIDFDLSPAGRHVGGVSSGSNPRTTYIVSRVSRIRYLSKHFGTGVWRRASYRLIAVSELITRGVSRRPEGATTRRDAVRLQFREIRAPGSTGNSLD